VTILESIGFEILKRGAAWVWTQKHAPFKVIYFGQNKFPAQDVVDLEGTGESPETVVEVRWGTRPTLHVQPTMFGADRSRLRMRFTATAEMADTCVVRLQDGTELRLKVEQLPT
jgi:hypothetical protein